jgi:LysR family transcriptional regulator, regulator for bpeEF and oprC
MRVFTRVVAQGSFARAADDLGISRPAVTTAIAQLEKRLATRLLNRTTRRVSLTEEGRVYHERCLRILDDVAEAEEALTRTRGSARGPLRVSVPQSFVHLLFFPALPGFLARHPDLKLEVVLTDRAVNLLEEGIDCATRGVGIPDDAALVARQIGESRWITLASPAYLDRHGTPRSVADLARHNCIRFISPSTGRTADWVFEERGKRVSFTPSGNLGVNSLEAAAAAALAGIGIAQVPDPIVFAEVLNGHVRALLIDRVALAPPLCVVYPSRRYLTARVRAFADFMAEIYPPRGWWPDIVAMSRSKPARKAAQR